MQDVLPVLAGLRDGGSESAVTYLGENVTTAKAAGAATDTYCALLDEVRRRGLGSTPSVKLTHLGLDLGEEVALENAERVLDRAGGLLGWLDMEGTAYTDPTPALYRELRRPGPNVARGGQAYLRPTPA